PRPTVRVAPTPSRAERERRPDPSRRADCPAAHHRWTSDVEAAGGQSLSDWTPVSLPGGGSIERDTQCRVDLVTQGNAARVGVGLCGVELVHDVAEADAVLEVDESERSASTAVAENVRIGSVDAALIQHVTQPPAVVGDAGTEAQVGLQA